MDENPCKNKIVCFRLDSVNSFCSFRVSRLDALIYHFKIGLTEWANGSRSIKTENKHAIKAKKETVVSQESFSSNVFQLFFSRQDDSTFAAYGYVVFDHLFNNTETNRYKL